MPEFVIATLMIQNKQNICPDNNITAMQDPTLKFITITNSSQHNYVMNLCTANY